MKKLFLLIVSLTVLSGCNEGPTRPAREVIRRFTGGQVPVKLSLSMEKEDGSDRFSYEVKDGILHLEGSSNVALCRAFYEYVRSTGSGINSWSGNRLELPETLADAALTAKTSPFRHHYYFNVVTYGYTMCYWDWERWEQEIDWMALHGIDMPLALVANEAISARVWKKLGLTEEEISDYFVGPAHLPWMRMGNISGLDSPMPRQWHEGQVALQHKILDRMRALGMSPICPGFAGFVPKEMARLYPDMELLETSWSGGAFHNWMVSPEDPRFAEIGRLFIEEWEKEFGKCGYYIADSFNEMDIPFPPKGSPERYELLADYGEKVYDAIRYGDPDAVWVMQGWMFGYQRDIWDPETLAALLSRVPDDKMLLLDLAADYNKCFWETEYNWEFYKGFSGKKWVYSVIPNMGGKTAMTGELEFYANGRLDAMRSPNRGDLEAFGFAPEGIENNEVIYELLSDAGWTADSLDLRQWLRNYTECRYGACPESMDRYWDGMLQSVYGSFTDHPRFNWQLRPGLSGRGTVNVNDAFKDGVAAFEEAASELSGSPLYAADRADLQVMLKGARMEEITRELETVYAENGNPTALEAEFLRLGEESDSLLSTHPTHSLDRWIGFARKWGGTPELADYYERNARRLVTIWGPPVDDYSARLWSGLIGSYYLPRWKHWFESKYTGKPFDFPAWEKAWVENRE